MKLIAAKMDVTRETLLSSSFDAKSAIEKEILVRLREVYEETVGHSVGNVVWDVMKGNVVELSTELLAEADIWRIKAQMVVPDENELFRGRA